MCATKAIEYYTYEDYCHWEGKWELIEGIPMAMSPSPNISHQAIAANILFELKKSIPNCNHCLVLAEEDWKINDGTVLKPDVVLICNEPNDQYITKAPEIVVEVISPSTSRRDEVFKFDIYEREQAAYYVIAYPDDYKAKIYKLENNQYIKQGDFSKESYQFENTSCNATIDFDAVFRQFR